MPTPKQMEKLAAEAARRPSPSAADAPLPAEYWESVLKDPRADATGAQLRQRLSFTARRQGHTRRQDNAHDQPRHRSPCCRNCYAVVRERGSDFGALWARRLADQPRVEPAGLYKMGPFSTGNPQNSSKSTSKLPGFTPAAAELTAVSPAGNTPAARDGTFVPKAGLAGLARGYTHASSNRPDTVRLPHDPKLV